MIRIPKSIVSFGAVALAVGALTLSVPRAAHAVAAALVEVSNTPASPAITQDTSKQANQIVHLYCPLTVDLTSQPCEHVLPNGSFAGTFTVPAPQSLAINSVDITVGAGTQTSIFGSVGRNWFVSGTNTVHFDYPSGLVIPPGTAVTMGASNSTVSGIIVDMVGYLTTN